MRTRASRACSTAHQQFLDLRRDPQCTHITDFSEIQQNPAQLTILITDNGTVVNRGLKEVWGRLARKLNQIIANLVMHLFHGEKWVLPRVPAPTTNTPGSA